MRAELANLNYYAVPFLSRAAVNLNWYDINYHSVITCHLYSTVRPLLKVGRTKLWPQKSRIILILIVLLLILSAELDYPRSLRP